MPSRDLGKVMARLCNSPAECALPDRLTKSPPPPFPPPAYRPTLHYTLHYTTLLTDCCMYVSKSPQTSFASRSDRPCRRLHGSSPMLWQNGISVGVVANPQWQMVHLPCHSPLSQTCCLLSVCQSRLSTIGNHFPRLDAEPGTQTDG